MDGHEDKRMKPTPPLVFFWGPKGTRGWLSNWSPHSLMEGGVVFRTAEHYLMYHKAIHMEDEVSARRILGANGPREAKVIGREVAGFDEGKWVLIREDIMYRALLLKVNSYPAMKMDLAATTGCIIAEASPYDAIWGIGCGQTNPKAHDPAQWPGLNLLGKAWMKVRDEI